MDEKTVLVGAGNERYLSSISRFLYDCEEETSEMLDAYWYSGNMKTGEVVWSSSSKSAPHSIARYFG
jgi:hypothetical protein